MANAAAVAGLATAVAVGLTLTNVISARFLRVFSRAHLQAVMQLVRRPAPGSIFEIKPDTKLAAILAAVSNGLITLDQATVTYAGFIDDESDGKKRAELVERYKLLTATKDIKTFSTASATATDMGVFSWLCNSDWQSRLPTTAAPAQTHRSCSSPPLSNAGVERQASSEFGMIARERGEKQHGISAGRPLKWRLRRACSPNEAWRAWQRSRFAHLRRDI